MLGLLFLENEEMADFGVLRRVPGNGNSLQGTLSSSRSSSGQTTSDPISSQNRNGPKKLRVPPCVSTIRSDYSSVCGGVISYPRGVTCGRIPADKMKILRA